MEARLDGRRWRRLAVAAVLAIGVGSSPCAARGAEAPTGRQRPPAQPPSENAPRSDELPRPDQARPVVAEPRPSATVLLWVPRAVLFVPRWVVWTAVQPIKYGLVAYERYAVRQRAIDLFFDPTRTWGVYPIGWIQRGQGVSVGLRGVHRNLFGRGGGLQARVGIGDRLRQDHRLSVDTGNALGRIAFLEARVSYRLRPRELFVGIGNRDLADVDRLRRLPTRIDARNDDTAVRTRYREDELAGGAAVGLRMGEHLSLRLTQQWTRKWFDDGILPGGDTWITNVYDPASLTGFRTGVDQGETSASLTYDDLHTTRRHVPPATPSAGWRIHAFQGVAAPVSARTRYLHAGLDAARYIDLYNGDRVLRLRARMELVHGGYDRIPFSELPPLGGPEILRGYPSKRFRDRLSMLASAEYVFPIDQRLSAYLFSDVGRVYRGIERLTFRGLRAGFGGGLQLHRKGVFFARIQIATSIDGGLELNLRFEPTFQIDERP